MSEPISVASYDSLPPANALVHALNERGIEAGLHNETADQAIRFFTQQMHAQFRVLVPPDQVDRALAELASLPPLPPERAHECPVTQVIRCPDCHSTLVEYPQFSRNTIVGALPSVAASLGLIEKDFFCRTCNYTWEPTPTPRPPVEDALS
jgi:hypothetical protein